MVVRIPHTSLSKDALLGLIDEFITRDSTVTDSTLEQKRERVLGGLAAGTFEITFDPDSSSTQIWSSEELRRIEQSSAE